MATIAHYSWLPWRKAWHLNAAGERREHDNAYWYFEFEHFLPRLSPHGWRLTFITPLIMISFHWRYAHRQRLGHAHRQKYGLWTGCAFGLIPTRWNLQLEEAGYLHRHRFEFFRPAKVEILKLGAVD